MKIECIYNKASYLPPDLMREGNCAGFGESSIYPMKVGQEFTVYGMTIYKEYPWYYIIDRDFTYYPIWRPSPLFEVTDSRLSRYWKFSYKKGVHYIQAYAVWAFPEWTDDPDYYDKLTDGFEREVRLFELYQEKMDLEFPNSSISRKAEIGDKEWLICPDCIDAWQSTNEKDALVKCPKCHQIFNNPRYKNEWPGLKVY